VYIFVHIGYMTEETWFAVWCDVEKCLSNGVSAICCAACDITCPCSL